MNKILLLLFLLLPITISGQSFPEKSGWEKYSLSGKVKSVKTSYINLGEKPSYDMNTQLTFYKNGLLESTLINNDLKLVSEYNNQKELIRTTGYTLIHEVDTMIRSTRHLYQKRGNSRIIKNWCNTSSYMQYQNGDKNSLKVSAKEEYDGKMVEFFDDSQNLIKYITYDKNDSITGTVLYRWQNKRLIERKQYAPDSSYISGDLHNYDSFPHVTHSQYRKGVETTSVLVYNKENHMIEKYIIKEDGSLEKEYYYEYEYDKKGNWTSCSKYDSLNQLITIGYQEIEYFK